MAATEFPDPFILSYPGSGPQRLQKPDGSAPTATDNANQLEIVTPRSGPPTLIHPDGSAVNLNAAVLQPYSLTVPPGVQVSRS